MKKLIAFILAVIMLMSLCACGSDDGSESTDTSKLNTGKNAPSEDMVMEDIAAALQIENEYASITSVETVKSLSEDGSYDITLNVTAETKYADWTYEADMSYTEYDQGWMINDVDWISSDYQQVRTPDIDTMVEYADDYLLNDEHYSYNYYYDHMTPMYNPTIDLYTSSYPNENKLQLNWEGIGKLKHADSMYQFTSYWQYDPEIDNWTLVPNDEHGSLGYYVDINFGGDVYPDYTLDFSGEWHAEKPSAAITLGALDTIIISNFSWDEFDVEVPGLEEYTNMNTHFTKTDDPFVFKNQDGDYIRFNFADYTSIHIRLSDDTIVAEAHVTTDLPPLA